MLPNEKAYLLLRRLCFTPPLVKSFLFLLKNFKGFHFLFFLLPLLHPQFGYVHVFFYPAHLFSLLLTCLLSYPLKFAMVHYSSTDSCISTDISYSLSSFLDPHLG